MTGRLSHKIALVTGAGRGMGRAHVERLLDEGAFVFVADIDHASAVAASALHSERAVAVDLDVTSEQSWSAAASTIADRHGRLDVLVNNAGILRTGSLGSTTLAEWNRVFEVNSTGVFLGLRSTLGLLSASGSASVVNVSSPAGLQGRANMAAYSASKFAVRGLTQSAAVELASVGIRVNSIHPGTVRTEMLEGHDETALAARIPLGRIGEPADVAALVAFLASDESSYITGSEFVIDGGRHAGPTSSSSLPR